MKHTRRRAIAISIVVHTLLIIAIALLGFASVYLWEASFGGWPVPDGILARGGMILLVILVFLVPQWLVFSFVSYIALSYISKRVFWHKGEFWGFLQTHAFFIILLSVGYMLWDFIGANLNDQFILFYVALGVAVLIWVYLKFQHSRISYFHAPKLHKGCMKKAFPWVLLHWICGFIIIAVLGYLFPLASSAIQVVMISGVLGAVVSFDIDRFNKIMSAR